jgi:acyl transferase domain-containing protein
MSEMQGDHLLQDVAIIGMSGRFPNSRDLDEFWQNLRGGIECVSSFSDEDLLSSGVDRLLISNPSYVRRKAFLEDTDLFDASFFGFNPAEAEIIDPQHRFFLESSYELLESAGYNPEEYAGLIGVYAGCSVNSYLLNNVLSNREVLERLGSFQVFIGSDKDFLTTRTSYKLNLKGPSIDIQTACSTSLVAVHLACQSLLNYECDMAIAGGVSISVPQKSGYLYQEGMVFSPDGRCRPFDAKAQGFVAGGGIGVVLLKRLNDSLTLSRTETAYVRLSRVRPSITTVLGRSVTPLPA